MFRRLKNNGESWSLFFWFALPFSGQLTAPFFILSAPFFRNLAGCFRPALLLFLALSCVYVLYIGAVSLAAGDYQTAIEPTGDAASLAITVALSAWVLRQNRRVALSTVYKASALLCIGLFGAAAMAYLMFGIDRPGLLMSNTLNLSPTLLVPAVLCTFGLMRLTGIWRTVSLLGFFLAVITIALILQTRGTLLVLLVLCAFRIVWLVFLESGNGSRFLVPGLVISSLIAGGMILSSQTYIANRYFIGANPLSDASVDLRWTMLEAGARAFMDSPLIGHGGQNRFEAARHYLPPDFEGFSHLHNDFLTHAVAGGIPAVLLLVLLLLFPVYVALRSPERNRDKLQIALIFTGAFTGTAIVNNVLFVDISAFSLGLSYVAAVLMIEAA